MEEPIQTAPALKNRVSGGLAALLLVSFLGISRIWVGGYHFGVADNAWQVPAIRALSSGEFAGDYIFSRPPSLSLFFPLVAALSKVFELQALYFAGYAAASVATAILLFRLASRMLSSVPAAVLAVLLLLTGKDVIAGATTWDPLFLPRSAAMPFMLLSWLSLLDAKAARAGVFIGIAFALHPLTGVYSGAVSAIYVASGERSWWRDLALFTLSAAPAAAVTLWFARGSEVPLLTADAAWYRAMLVRNIHHVVSDRFPLMAGLLLYALWAGTRMARMGGRQRLLQAATIAAAVAFMYSAAALAAGEILGLAHPALALLRPPALAILQPLRVSGILGILIIVATAGLLWDTFERGRLLSVIAGCAALALFHEHWTLGALLTASAVVGSSDFSLRKYAAAALALAAAAVALFSDPSLLVMLAALAALTAALRALAPRFGARPASAALAAVVILAGVVPAAWAPRVSGMVFPRHLLDANRYGVAVDIDVTRGAAFEEAARWMAANAPEDAVAVVPPWWEGFRVASGRPVFGTWKDGTLVFFREDLAGEWLERMALLAASLKPGIGSRYPAGSMGSYASLDEAALRRAAGRFRADYVVRERADLPGLRMVYGGENVYIYAIEGEGRRR